jgi:hypothetical protein
VAVRSEEPADDTVSGTGAAPDFAIIGDPLWGIAIASVILFAALAALIAFG